MNNLPKLSWLQAESNQKGTYFCKLELLKGTPFNIARFVVEPKMVSKLDQHEVKEIWCVVSGEGILDHNGTDYFIKTGDYYFMNSNETHQVQNSSESNELVIYSIWW